MKAYKFRASQNISFALDIIFNGRLYCADWRTLNDPMEGMFGYAFRSSSEDDVKERVADVVREKQDLRVCSLSMTYQSPLLWAHYASGFDGVAIEVDLPNSSEHLKVVSYDGVQVGLDIDGVVNPYDAARVILSSKYREWAYEREIRVLQSNKWYKLRSAVKLVIAGHRMNPALFTALKIICDQKNIELAKTRISDGGVDADCVPPLFR